MGLGLDNIIKNMDPGLKKTFGNMISISFIMVVLYAVLSLVFLHSLNFMGFLTSADFTSCVMLGFFLYLAWSILSGKKINIPQQKQKVKPKPTYVKPRRPRIQKQQPVQMEEIIIEEKKTTKRIPKQNNPVIRGSWKCPKCEFLVVGSSRCPNCGFQRRR